ncbi:hypothetical protein [Pseudogemmobacter humi]|uniref:Uncharacterized protein n=1 Tax=Pseudogemmobacter humi TaxID=2483812 RepID=A0A3P5XNM9_9RHOB|nr:hypothetical protein [Pseudogemmobacter humi]VDC30346.1 hypothetical protein XINFAN_02528 [Pseudogemmobacter humi]
MKRRAGRQTLPSTGTALRQYQRLECIGLWRDAPEDQRREVVVRMGEATLVLSDPRSETALSHWSLPAVRRINPGQRPAVFAPGEDSRESVEIEDEAMVSALKTVHSAVRAARPHPGRLRGWLIGGTVAAIAAVAVLVLPGVLISHTASVVPAPKRAEIGMRALDDVIRLTGAPCDGDVGLPALAALAERVFGPEDTPILYILPEGLSRPAHLPGGVILLPKGLIEQDAPDALAGAALAEGLAAKLTDPMRDILDHAGLKASFDLLTSGDLPAGALDGYGEAFLRRQDSPPPLTRLTAAFTEAQVPLTPYAQWLAGPESAAMQEADPFRGLIATPLLPDDDWIALQSVCSDG